MASSFGNESGQIHPANPSLGTDASPGSVTLSSGSPPILTDTATLSGGFEETGTLTFDLYAPGGDVPVDAETVTVNGDGSYTTPTGYTLPTTGTVTGTYQWVVTYSGDANNNGVASASGDEPVAVNIAAPSISTTANPIGVTLDGERLTHTERLGDPHRRLQRDGHHHLHALRARRLVGRHRNGHGEWQRHLQHADRLHSAGHWHGDRHLPVGRQLQRRRQQQRGNQREWDRASYGQPGHARDQHDSESDRCHTGRQRLAHTQRLGHARRRLS